jgi:hypothetical protein
MYNSTLSDSILFCIMLVLVSFMRHTIRYLFSMYIVTTSFKTDNFHSACYICLFGCAS